MDELSLLREMRDRTPIATDAALDRGRTKLLQRIDPQSVKLQKNPRRRMALRWGLAAAATALVAAVLVGGDVFGPAPLRGAATAQAAEVLNAAAETTIQTADLVPGPGQYLKIQSTNIWGSAAVAADGSEYEWLDTEKSTMYIPANREEEWVWERSGRIPTTFFDEKSKAYASSMEPAEGYVLRGNNGGFYGTPPQQSSFPSQHALAAFPRDPNALLNEIQRQTDGKGQSKDGEALVFIADLLRTGMVPADLRAALYKAAALIPGVTVTDEQATLDGRKGIAIGRVETASHRRQDIIIDPKTGQLIGEREVLTEPQGSMPAGTATTWTAIETTISETAP